MVHVEETIEKFFNDYALVTEEQEKQMHDHITVCDECHDHYERRKELEDELIVAGNEIVKEASQKRSEESLRRWHKGLGGESDDILHKLLGEFGKGERK